MNQQALYVSFINKHRTQSEFIKNYFATGAGAAAGAATAGAGAGARP